MRGVIFVDRAGGAIFARKSSKTWNKMTIGSFAVDVSRGPRYLSINRRCAARNMASSQIFAGSILCSVGQGPDNFGPTKKNPGMS